MALLLCGHFSVAFAQEQGPAGKSDPARGKASAQPAYPRTSLATGYLVDSSWPVRTKEQVWGAMAGIALGCGG